MKELQNLLDEFKGLPQIPDTIPTMIEIAGFPHYENVCSNILAYFFDTSGPHHLGDLLLSSLLSCAGLSELVTGLITVEVRREESTQNAKRIDLVIETNELAIAIENKIYAGIYNDLYEYAGHLERNYKTKSKRILLVLSLERVFSGSHGSGFKNVTYTEFIACIKARLGDYAIDGGSKSIIFLLDFLKTIQNLNKPDTMNPEVIDFFAKNEQLINELFSEKKKVQNYVSTKVNQLAERIGPKGEHVHQWIYLKEDLVHDFSFGEIMVSVDCGLTVDGIEVVVWVRKGNNPHDILRRLKLHEVFPFSEIDLGNNRCSVVAKKDLPLLTPLDEIVKRLDEILDNIYFVKEDQ